MAYISSIINYIQQTFDISIKGDIPDNRSISAVRFLGKTDSRVDYLTPDILFIGNYVDFKSCTFIGNVILTGAGKGRIKGDALLIKEDINLFELMNAISDSLQNYQLLQNNKDSLFSMLKNGHNMNLILKKAFGYLENPITICDSSFTIIDSYPNVEDSRSLEIRNNRLVLKSVFSQDMKETKLTEHIFHSVYPFITKVDNFPYDWAFESIRINHSVVGYVCVRGNNRAFTDDDLELIHHMTQIISVYLQKDSSYTNPQSIKNNRFLKELFLCHFDNVESIHSQISMLGMKPANYYYILAYDFVDSTKNHLSKDYFCQQLQSIFPWGITGTFEGLFVTLLPVESTTPYPESVADRLITFLQMNRMVGALSFVFTDLMEASTYQQQCQSIFSMMNPEETVGQVLRYGDYCFRHITTLLDDPNLFLATIHPALKFMYAYDLENSTEYLETLRTYIQKNRSAPAAAEALHIHKSTFFYRIEKMKSLFNIDITNPDNMFAYEISLKIMDISGRFPT